MTNQDVINFLNQVRKMLLDDRSWLESTIQPINEAFDKAISALQEQDLQPTCNNLATDAISRTAAIDAIVKWAESNNENPDGDDCIMIILELPSAQPEPSEITDEQAILHLQSTEWMQRHDKEMYENGLREQLADDSGSYDSLIPCEDTISRQAAIDALIEGFKRSPTIAIRAKDMIEQLLSAQPEPSIPISWIEKQIDWLKSMDNGFSNLSAMNISVLMKKWRKENGKDEQSD